MTQEDKDLLLKDLCGRLPYGVKVDRRNHIHELESTLKCGLVLISDIITNKYITTNIENITPYLFPLSSMTEEQKEEYESLIYNKIEMHSERYDDVIVDGLDWVFDFYHKHHLDYRYLIPKGLAIDCTNLNIY